ncbi:SLC13 family permease [Natronobiforma cellulositropha]|uniref:SLC13 family permease n=1 Tax=Natronobiforma cellulositropha TaxID=1679076 RepID=UPI0021D58A9C|nr:SLC13 family permease [Natronobiforma cellulositropha]
MTLFRRTTASLVQSLGITGATAILVVGVLAPSGLDSQIQAVLAVFLATVVLWITKPVPYEISSVLCVVLLYVLGTAESFSQAASGFSDSLVFFLLLLLLLGKSVSKVGLDEWVANRLTTATSTPRSSFWRLSSAILLLAFLMPSGMARAVAFMPVVDQINETYGLGDDSPFRRVGYFLVGHVNPMVSLALMTGGGMSVLTAELIDSMVRPITWIEWALFMAPPVVALYVGIVLTSSRLFSIGDTVTVTPTPERDATAATDGEAAGGSAGDSLETDAVSSQPLSPDQRFVVTCLLFAISLWIVGSFVGIPTILPAMIVVAIFSLPWYRIITVDEFRTLSWGFLFLIGTMLSLIEVMQAVGAFDFVLGVVFSVVPADSHTAVVLAILFLFAIGLRSSFSSIAAAILILFPVFVEFAAVLEINALFLSFTLLLVLAATIIFPFNFSTVLIAYERGPLSLLEVTLLGLLTLAFATLVATLSWLLYWPVLETLTSGLF